MDENEKLREAAAEGDIDEASKAITAGADVDWKNPEELGITYLIKLIIKDSKYYELAQMAIT